MRKLFIALFLTIAIADANAQVVFINGIQPNTTYAINRQMNMVMTMAPPEAMAAMAGGQDIKMNMVFNTTTTMVTMAKNSQGQIPLSFTSKVGENKMTMNGQEMPSTMIPASEAEMTANGKYDGNKIIVESITGKTMNDSLRTMMNQIIEKSRNSTKFPDHAIKIGDTFTSDVPFALPLPGMSQKNAMDITSTFKLVKLDGSIGTFDITITVKADVNQSAAGQDLGVAVSGSGSGTMTFDAKKEFYTGMNMKMMIDFGISTGGMNIKGKGDLNMTDKVDIASK